MFLAPIGLGLSWARAVSRPTDQKYLRLTMKSRVEIIDEMVGRYEWARVTSGHRGWEVFCDECGSYLVATHEATADIQAALEEHDTEHE